MDDLVTIRFKGRVTLEVEYGPGDVEETDFFPEDMFGVRKIKSDLPNKTTFEFENGSFIYDVSNRLFEEV